MCADLKNDKTFGALGSPGRRPRLCLTLGKGYMRREVVLFLWECARCLGAQGSGVLTCFQPVQKRLP